MQDDRRCMGDFSIWSYVHGVRAAWLCIGPGLVLRGGLVVEGDRTGCAWVRVVGVGLVVHEVRASM